MLRAHGAVGAIDLRLNARGAVDFLGVVQDVVLGAPTLKSDLVPGWGLCADISRETKDESAAALAALLESVTVLMVFFKF